MDAQQVLALMVVGVAAFLLIRRKLRARRSCAANDGACGCGDAVKPPLSGSILFRARKDGSREIVVRKSS